MGCPEANKNNLQEQKENYYTILGCTESATLDELKRCYQELVKRYHPDKQSGTNVTSDRFILIDKAFKTLKDEKLRREYDAFLFENDFQEDPMIFAELLKSDLVFVDGHSSFVCRCGNEILIPDDILEEVIIECSECSNCILIK